MKTNEHIEAILDYMHADEEKHFIEDFELDVDLIGDTFKFEVEHESHIFYHVYKLNEAQRTNTHIVKAIAELLRYSLLDVHFEYEQLTDDEKEIVGGQEGMDAIIEWTSEHLHD